MSILAIVVFVIGFLALAVGSIMILVAAFRTHIGWGLASFFIWPVELVYVVTHWEESKKGVMISLFGALTAYGALTSFGDNGVLKQAERFIASKKPAMSGSIALESAAPAHEMTIDEVETELRTAEADFAATQEKVKVDFNNLMVQRAKLGSDEAALAAYNAAHQAYEQQNASLPAKAQKVTQLREQADAMTQAELEAARNAKKNGSKAPSPLAGMLNAPKKAAAAGQAAKATMRGEVIMYTTRSCPACVAAKNYFAKKRVEYREIDVQSDPKGQEEFRKLGGSGVPLILVNGERMEGFNAQRLDSMLL